MPEPVDTLPPFSNAEDHNEPLLPAYQQRISQLTRDGLIDFFRPVVKQKTNVFPGYEVRPPKPMLGAFGGNKGFIAKHASIRGTVPPSGFYTFEDCYIAKCGTVLDSERRVFYSEDLISSYWMWFLGKLINHTVLLNTPAGQTCVARFIGGCDKNIKHIAFPSATLVNLTKPGPTVYGHWILDVLPMLFNFFEAHRSGLLQAPFKFLLTQATPQWAKSLLKTLFGITDDSIVTFDDNREVLHAEKVIVPSLLRVSPLISPRMNDFVSFVFKQLDLTEIPNWPVHAKNIFISRENFANDENRFLTNHADILTLVRQMGFSVVRPESLAWRDQLSLFSQADIVMGEYGSGIHNTLFSPSSTISIVMVNLKSNWNQSSIAALRGQDTIYVRPSMQERVGKANGIRFAFDVDTLREAMSLAVESKTS